MIPQIFSFGPFPINSFGLFIALSLYVGIFTLSRSFEINGIKGELAERYVLTGGIVGLLGARVWYIFTHWQDVKDDLVGAIFSGAGFVFYGGFIFGSIALLILAKIDKVKIVSFLDSIGPTLALGYAIGRIGCQLSGDGDYGIPTDGFWGMSYANGVVPTPIGIRAYPAPVFESIMACGIFSFLFSIERKQKWLNKPLSRFSVYLMLIAIERFLIEFIRRNKKFDIGFEIFGSEVMLSQAQIISIGLVIITLAMVVLPRFNSNSKCV